MFYVHPYRGKCSKLTSIFFNWVETPTMIYIYIYTWNPFMTVCFAWSRRAFFWRLQWVSTSKAKVCNHIEIQDLQCFFWVGKRPWEMIEISGLSRRRLGYWKVFFKKKLFWISGVPILTHKLCQGDSSDQYVLWFHFHKCRPVLKTPSFLSFKLSNKKNSKQPTPRMAKHYVCRTTDLPAHARSEAEKLCGSGRGITPAWVEQCSAESDDFDGLVKQLKVGPDKKWGWRC